MNKALKLHEKLKGKIEIKSKIKVTKNNLSLLYTPGVAEATRAIAKDPKASFKYTSRGNNIAIITDGSRTIGVGNTVPEASLPVMEGKALLANFFSGVNAYPFCLDTKERSEIVQTIKFLAPNFSVFNIEDIQSPKCFEIMEDLEKTDLIFFNDDHQGVAIVVLAALLNSLKLVGKKMEEIKICLGGAGVAGYGVFKILKHIGVSNIVVFDANGIVFRGREEDNKYLKDIAEFTNPENLKGRVKEAIKDSDVFIGLSGVGNILTADEINLMNKKPIIFAISNPNPEILPKEIEKAVKDYIYATGRSDFPNQINNLVVFPGILKGLCENQIKMNLDLEVKIGRAVASLIKKPRKDYIIPNPFDKRLVKTIVNCFKK